MQGKNEVVAVLYTRGKPRHAFGLHFAVVSALRQLDSVYYFHFSLHFRLYEGYRSCYHCSFPRLLVQKHLDPRAMPQVL